MKIHVKKGLDIPVAGKPTGSPQTLNEPTCLSLNLDTFETTRFKVHVKPQDNVKIGTPLAESKDHAKMLFVSPAAGLVKEIKRGEKRRLLHIVIERHPQETYEEQKGLSLSSSREVIVDYFLRCGAFTHIRMRPFDLLASPKSIPRDIFVKAVETLPFVPSAEMQISGNEELFQIGLDALTRLTTGKVHLVFNENSNATFFSNAQNVVLHTIKGPHPSSSSSIHIHNIAPIKSAHDIVWTLSTIDVLVLGSLVKQGRYFVDRVISIAGNGVKECQRGFFKGRMGFPIEQLIQNRIISDPTKLISGDPLVGTQVGIEDFLGFYDTALSVLPENTTREPFHFFRLGLKKYSASRTYFTGHIKPPKEGYSFTTNQHGEERAFIDSAVYDKVMPMKIPTMHLIKAILSRDFEMAEKLGLLEVAPEDFALPTFVCPSKIEMIQIVKEGLLRYAKEMGY